MSTFVGNLAQTPGRTNGGRTEREELLAYQAPAHQPGWWGPGQPTFTAQGGLVLSPNQISDLKTNRQGPWEGLTGGPLRTPRGLFDDPAFGVPEGLEDYYGSAQQWFEDDPLQRAEIEGRAESDRNLATSEENVDRLTENAETSRQSILESGQELLDRLQGDPVYEGILERHEDLMGALDEVVAEWERRSAPDYRVINYAMLQPAMNAINASAALEARSNRQQAAARGATRSGLAGAQQANVYGKAGVARASLVGRAELLNVEAQEEAVKRLSTTLASQAAINQGFAGVTGARENLIAGTQKAYDALEAGTGLAYDQLISQNIPLENYDYFAYPGLQADIALEQEAIEAYEQAQDEARQAIENAGERDFLDWLIAADEYKGGVLDSFIGEGTRS